MKENFFVRLGRLVLAYPKTSLLLILLEFGLLLSQLPRLQVDTSAESFLHKNAKAIVDYDKFRAEFGRDEFFIVAISGQDVFTLDFLAALRDFHEALEQQVSMLQSVESLVNVRSIYGDGDELIAEDLLENFPQNEQELAVIKQRVRSKPVYYDRLINDDEDTVTLLVKQVPYIQETDKNGHSHLVNLGDEEILQGYLEIEAVVEQFRSRFGKNTEIVIGGTTAMGSNMSIIIQHDFGVFTAVAIVMIIIVLSLLFKRVSGVVIPLLVMAVGVTSCIALMPILGYPLQITTSILPSFLLAVCIGDSVHMLTIFYRSFDGGASKKESLLYALQHTGTAVLFTSMTTAAGLLTFAISEIQPVASLGLFAAIGSVLAFIITIIMIPVLLWLSPVKSKGFVADDSMKVGSLLYKFTRFCLHLSTEHPRKVVAVGITLLVVSASLVPGIRFSQDSLTWFPDETPVKQAVRLIERKITGSMPVEIVIDTGKEQGVLEPEFLHKLDAWLTGLEGRSFNDIPIISINSINSLIKETHQAFSGNHKEAYVVPDDKETVAQELLLVEMDQADDLYEFTDHKFRQTRLTLIVPWGDAIKFDKFQQLLREDYAQHLGSEYPMHITGVIPIFAKLFAAMIQSAAESYLIAAVVITLMMIILMRGVVDGLLSMLPNLLPIVMVLAFMVLIDLPLDVFTVLIGSIALGLAVDDTVHFMHGFQAAFKRDGDAKKAIEETLISTGKAMMITTVVLFFGFMTFTLSDLRNMDNFGTLTAICIVIALIADFIFAPALMMLRYGNKKPVS